MNDTNIDQARIPTLRACMLKRVDLRPGDGSFGLELLALSAKMRLEAVLLGETLIVPIGLACLLRERA